MTWIALTCIYLATVAAAAFTGYQTGHHNGRGSILEPTSEEDCQ